MMEMTPYSCMTKEELENEYAKVLAQSVHEDFDRISEKLKSGKN